MKVKKQRLSCAEVRQWDIVTFLHRLGYNPVRVTNTDDWYLSPLRDERTPSFKVARGLNKWYDHGIGKGGNLVDFGVLYFNCSVSLLLKKLEDDFSFHQPCFNQTSTHGTGNKITIVQAGEITSPALLRYLEQRKIASEIAVRYCREAHFKLADKTYFAIGFANNAGGYELRNRFFKGSSFPKDITLITNGPGNGLMSIFEGFVDFLSYLTWLGISNQEQCDYIILNSLSLFEKAMPFLEGYDRVSLYLDNDKAGQNCSSYALSLGDKFQDERYLYAGFKDFNDWLMNVAGSSG